MSALIFLWENGSILPQQAQEIERWSLDFRFQNFSPFITASDKIIFVDVDTDSLNFINSKEGPWPWRRNVWDENLKTLSEARPKAILFDILISESDSENPEIDQQLADTIGGLPNVSLAVGFATQSPKKIFRQLASEPSSQISKFSIDIGDRAPANSQFSMISGPYPSLRKNIQHMHFVNAFKDADGRMRSVPMFLSFQGQHYPSLPLKAVQMNDSNTHLFWEDSHLRMVSSSHDFKVPLDSSGRLFLQFYSGSFQTVPMSLIYKLARSVEPKAAAYLKKIMHDKILIIGSSASALNDLKPTPIDNNYPGAILHATAVSNVLERHFLAKPFANNVLVLAVLLVALIYLNFAFVNNTALRVILPAAALTFYILISVYLFQVDQIDLPLTTPLLFGFLSYADGFVLTLLSEIKPKLISNERL